MAVTIYDVAEAANVGISTVSRVLNDNANVRPDTRRKVLAAMKDLGYQPNVMARNLARPHIRSVGVVLRHLSDPFHISVLEGIERALSQAGTDLIIFNLDSEDRREGLLNKLSKGRRSDGLILISLTLPAPLLARLRGFNLPIVAVDHFDPNLPSVYVDNVYGGYLATRHLLNRGHRRIAYIQDHFSAPSGPGGNWPGLDRRIGYVRALDEANVAVEERYIRDGGGHSRPLGRAAAEALLALSEPPTAIFAASDMLALGVIEHARSAGIVIPDQLAVVGFDDIELASFAGLTTVRQPMQHMGYRAAQMALRLMEGQTLVASHCRLPLELVVRQSSASFSVQEA